jgi:hypothetical protein
MSTQYAGDPSNVTTPLTRTVINATAATPIEIQTSVPHGFSTGDDVEVESVVGVPAANTATTIVVTGADTFTLDGTVGVGAYVSGGTVKDESLTPAVTQPADGDLRSAASVNLAIDDLADWCQYLARKARPQKHTWTAAGTMIVPDGCYWIDYAMVGGGGGGGGGRGNGGVSAAGGGGAKRITGRARVVPGETITFAPGAGGLSGTGGNAGGAAGTAGGHGGDSTLTGSVSGLIATARGAQGAMYATTGGWSAGGMPERWSTLSALRTYPNNSVTPLTVAAKFYPTYPLPGQGGHAGDADIADVMMKWGGATGYSAGGSSGTVDGTFAGSGGASEWPGGIGGSGSAFNTFNHFVNGGNGIYGSGGGGGTGGFTGYQGGNGGTGGVGACEVKYNGPLAVFT